MGQLIRVITVPPTIIEPDALSWLLLSALMLVVPGIVVESEVSPSDVIFVLGLIQGLAPVSRDDVIFMCRLDGDDIGVLLLSVLLSMVDLDPKCTNGCLRLVPHLPTHPRRAHFHSHSHHHLLLLHHH